MEILPNHQQITCSHCAYSKEAKRLPTNWKRHKDSVWCKKCWNKLFVLRTIAVPIASLVNMEWTEFRELLKQFWSQSTALSNWATQQIYMLDPGRMPNDKKLKKMPIPYLYPGARAVFPAMSTRAIISILNSVQKRYRKARFKSVWLRKASLPSYRYPVPFPIHNESWSVCKNENGNLVVSISLARKRTLLLRLREGHQFKRQCAQLEQIISKEALQGEFSFYCQKASVSDHRNGITKRDIGKNKIHTRVMAKIAVWLPRKKNNTKKQGKLEVHTSTDSFIVCRTGKNPWVLNLDHIPRFVVMYNKRMKRLCDDLKKSTKKNHVRNNIEKLSDKYKSRTTAWNHQVSSMIANLANRLKCSEVMYDDTNQSFVENYPWHDLRQKLKYKLDELGIKFQEKTQATDKPSAI